MSAELKISIVLDGCEATSDENPDLLPLTKGALHLLLYLMNDEPINHHPWLKENIRSLVKHGFITTREDKDGIYCSLVTDKLKWRKAKVALRVVNG